jgi:mycothiol synthase
MQVDNVQNLAAGQLSGVLYLIENATGVDKVAPLSEQALLAVRGGPPAGGEAAQPTSAPHFLAYDGPHLAGYAHLERGLAGEDATAEVVVDPGHRRHGVGTLLIHALENALTPQAATSQSDAASPPPGAASSRTTTPALRLWSHGHLDGARALALRDGYSILRELWQMRRSLRADSPSLPVVSLPEGFSSRHFVVGQDEDAWLRVNAEAFVDHPEQGRMTRADLDQRIAEPWFDAEGFILVEDTRGVAPVLAASHWTKIVPAEDPQVSATEGEVYVVGVHPAYQGLGLGRAVTILGLAHLRGKGLSEATLYVDADNGAAVATYSRLGFARCAVDVMYSRTVHLPV